MKNRAVINKILPFSSVDGPGNRTAVFVQGCNLDCQYCHNPETRKLCNSCGICVAGCPAKALSFIKNKICYAYALCVSCDQCIRACTYGASPKACSMTADEVFKLILKQVPYIRGVTVSGGECMLYPGFLTELAILCKGVGLGVLLDSNGMVDFSEYPQLLEAIDGVMLDIKAFDEDDHRLLTGSGNETVLKNLDFLMERGKLEEIRTVVVEDLFDVRYTVKKAARKGIRYKLISFRPHGVRQEYTNLRVPSSKLMAELEAIAIEGGAKAVRI